MASGHTSEIDGLFASEGRGIMYPTPNSSSSSFVPHTSSTVTSSSFRENKGNFQTSRKRLIDNATSNYSRHADDRVPDATSAEDPRTNLRKLLDLASELKNVDLDSGLNEYKMMMEGRDPLTLTKEEMYAKRKAGVDTPTFPSSGEMQMTIDRLRTDRDKYREEVDKLTRELQTAKQTYAGFNNEKLSRLEMDNKSLKEELAKETEKYVKLKEDVKNGLEAMQLKEMEAEQKHKDEIEKLKQILKSKKDELRQREKEKAEALNRLSKEMGNKLNNKNPNIADLSDSNRPTKIAEKYNELYDNEWTDAMETLMARSMSEKTVIHQLLEILQTCYQFCQVLSREQMNNLYKQLSEPYSTQSHFTTSQIGNIPSDIERLLIECRKTKGVISLDYLYNEYMKQTTRHMYAHYVQEYVKKCLEVCWLMLLQDPPVAFREAYRTGDTFDTALYKAYTKSGDKVSFTVWLPLMLHAKGPLLAKGVVQPFATESSGSDRLSKSASARSTSHRDDRRTNAYDTNQRQTAGRNTNHGTSRDKSGEIRHAWTEHKPDQHSGTWFSQSNPSTPDRYDQGTEYHKRNDVGNENMHLGYPIGQNSQTHNVMSNTVQNYPAYSEPFEVYVQGVPFVRFQGKLYTQAYWCSYGSALLRDTTSGSSTA